MGKGSDGKSGYNIAALLIRLSQINFNEIIKNGPNRALFCGVLWTLNDLSSTPITTLLSVQPGS